MQDGPWSVANSRNVDRDAVVDHGNFTDCAGVCMVVCSVTDEPLEP